jgi:glycosyltransferase involved in cell wall biosynthesis
VKAEDMGAENTQKYPFVSIVIPTRNRLSQLKLCLQAVYGLKYPKNRYEVIIVDNGSKDGTPSYLEEMQIKQDNFKWCQCKKRGRAVCTNFGIKLSKGEIILSTDDDAIVDQDWIRQHVVEYSDENIGAVGGMEHVRKNDLFAAFICSSYLDEFEKYMIIKGTEQWRGIGTMNASYRKEIFEKVGFFDEAFSCGADPEFVYRILQKGYVIAKNPKIRVTHLKEDTLKSFLRTRWRRGVGIILFEMKHCSLTLREFIIILTPKMILEDFRRFRRLTKVRQLDFVTALKLAGISILSYYVTHFSRLYHYFKFRPKYTA